MKLKIGKRIFEVSNLENAIEVFNHERESHELSGKGSRTFPDGRIEEYRISYNGRVWHTEKEKSI